MSESDPERTFGQRRTAGAELDGRTSPKGARGVSQTTFVERPRSGHAMLCAASRHLGRMEQ